MDFIDEMAITIAKEGDDMFGPFRSFPFRGLVLVALGFLLASALAGNGPGAAAGLGLVLLPFLLFKMLFLFFVFGALFRFAGAGAGGWGPRRGPGWGRYGHGPSRREESSESDNRWSDQERQDWEESLRQAREELREYDSPFSPPPKGFEPPADEQDS